MILTYTLSGLPNKQKNKEIKLDDRVDCIQMEELNNIEIDLMNFSALKQAQVREETSRDPVLNGLAQIFEMPTDLRQFWSYRYELAVEDGIIFKGRQVLIPRLLRPDILAQLTVATRHRENQTLESVYWLRINKDIEDLCKRCHLCQELQPQQPREPMKMHEKPGCPWVKLGTDLFEIGRRNFLIISDYFSCYPIIKELKSITSAAVVTATMEILSMFSVPREIVSDNGPQYQGIYNQFCAE